MGESELIAISTDKGLVTWEDIKTNCELYLESIPQTENIKTGNKSTVKTGCIKHIFQSYIMPIVSIKDSANRYNIDVLNQLFDLYIAMCYMLNIVGNMHMFCYCVNISYNYINQILNHDTNSSYGNIVNKDIRDTVKTWNSVIESMLVNTVTNDNSIGGIFMLKSKFAYTELQRVQIDVANDDAPVLSVSELESIAASDDIPPINDQSTPNT